MAQGRAPVRRLAHGWLLATCLFVSPGAVAAPPLEAPPWHRAVSEEDKAAARGALSDGNAHFREGRFGPALSHYEVGLLRWDHPGLQLMKARALAGIGHPAEALEALWEARRHGGHGLDQVMAEDVLRLEDELVHRQLALLVVDHDGSGPVTLGGRTISSARGRWVGFVAHGALTLGSGGRARLPLEVRPRTRVHIVIPMSGEPTVSERPLSMEDVEAHAATLPRPPRPIVLAELPERAPFPFDFERARASVGAIGRSEDVVAACAKAGRRLRRLCEAHERRLAALTARIEQARTQIPVLLHKIASVTNCCLVETLE